jgi:hypothetical protein
MEEFPGRMVTPMDHDVTVRTRSILQHPRLLINGAASTGGDGQKLSRMKHIRVTTLTEHRLLYEEERFMRTAVWIVAIETAFADRRMLPEKRPTLFAMTLITLIID